jgi:tRNA-splicing ligase RtcB
MEITKEQLIQLGKFLYEIPQSFRSDMRVPARIFANDAILTAIFEDRSLWQLVNIATLPGIAGAAFAMPDMHEGYGFPIGGVAGTAIENGGVISPGGIGYDINCGIRLLKSSQTYDTLKPFLPDLATEIFTMVPSGVGRGGRVKLTKQEMDEVLQKGAAAMLDKGYGMQLDLALCEENGCMQAADPAFISDKAKERGSDQLGTLGSGNHFLEIQRVSKIFDSKIAQVYGLFEGQIVVMIHCGSRGLGHQTCTDYVRLMMHNVQKWNIQLPDKELVCAPFKSDEAQQYFAAMQAAANFAWANRHLIAHWVRTAWKKIINVSDELQLLYDVSHNIGKVETHQINGKPTSLVVHRKGATRAFGPGREEIPVVYQSVGQPVLIPGTMGTPSYVLAGTKEGMDLALGSSCHGAGRKLSRVKAKKVVRGSELRKQLESLGIIVRCESDAGLAEEAPVAYKDIEDVVKVVDESGLARIVVQLLPLAVIKGG